MRSTAREMLALLATIVTLVAVPPMAAHELQPGFLELKEVAPGRYDVLWKLPSLGEASDLRMPLAPIFPETCRQLGDARTETVRHGLGLHGPARLQGWPGRADVGDRRA